MPHLLRRAAVMKCRRSTGVAPPHAFFGVKFQRNTIQSTRLIAAPTLQWRIGDVGGDTLSVSV